MGLRASTLEDTALLRHLLATHVVPDDDRSAPNYSVRLGRSPRELDLLFWGGCLVHRSRDRTGFLRGLLNHVGGHGPRVPGWARLDAVALVLADQSVLAVPSTARTAAWRLAARQGAEVAATPWVDVHARSASVSLQAPTIGVSEDGWSALGGDGRPFGDQPVAVGSLRAWFLAIPQGQASPTLALLAAASQLAIDPSGQLQELLDLAAAVPPAPLEQLEVGTADRWTRRD